MKYRKKPVVIEAFQLGTDYIPDWFMDKVTTNDIILRGHDGADIMTLEGVMYADLGDFIIKGVKGEIYPCKPDIFTKTYERVSKYKRNISKHIFAKHTFTKEKVHELMLKHYPECKIIISEEVDVSKAPYEFWTAYAENPRERDFEAGVAFTIRHLTDNKRNSIDISRFISDISSSRTWKSESEWADFVKRNIVEDF